MRFGDDKEKPWLIFAKWSDWGDAKPCLDSPWLLTWAVFHLCTGPKHSGMTEGGPSEEGRAKISQAKDVIDTHAWLWKEIIADVPNYRFWGHQTGCPSRVNSYYKIQLESPWKMEWNLALMFHFARDWAFMPFNQILHNPKMHLWWAGYEQSPITPKEEVASWGDGHDDSIGAFF